MRTTLLTYLCSFVLVMFVTSFCNADVDWKINSEITFEHPPVDMALSRDAQWLYMLFRNGDLQIYTYDGKLTSVIKVGRGYDGIEAGPREDEIYLLSRTANKIQLIEAIPPRQIDTNGSPFKGAADAPVVIAEFTDFQCPYCAKLAKVFSNLLKHYPGKIKIVYKSYPLGNHRYAWKAAANAVAAHQMGKFWEFHDRLFDKHATIDDNTILAIRKELGLDSLEFDMLTKSTEVRTKVAMDRQEGQSIGVRATPTVYINGKRVKDKSLEGLKAAIDKELEALGK